MADTSKTNGRLRESAEHRAEFERGLEQLNSYAQSKNQSQPYCYISYTTGNQGFPWEDARVQHLVARLHGDLNSAGLNSILPPRSNSDGDTREIVDRIASSDRILVVCTPLYLKILEHRSLSLDSLFQVEADEIESRLHGSEEQRASVIPLQVAGNQRFSVPTALRDFTCYDFRDDTKYFATTFDLALSLYGISLDEPELSGLRTSIRKMVFGQNWVSGQEPDDEPAFNTEQLKASLVKLGEQIRKEAFDAGRPLIVLKDGKPTWIYPDGTERIAATVNEPLAGER